MSQWWQRLVDVNEGGKGRWKRKVMWMWWQCDVDESDARKEKKEKKDEKSNPVTYNHTKNTMAIDPCISRFRSFWPLPPAQRILLLCPRYTHPWYQMHESHEHVFASKKDGMSSANHGPINMAVCVCGVRMACMLSPIAKDDSFQTLLCSPIVFVCMCGPSSFSTLHHMYRIERRCSVPPGSCLQGIRPDPILLPLLYNKSAHPIPSPSLRFHSNFVAPTFSLLLVSSSSSSTKHDDLSTSDSSHRPSWTSAWDPARLIIQTGNRNASNSNGKLKVEDEFSRNG